jgi:hypothetical protein
MKLAMVPYRRAEEEEIEPTGASRQLTVAVEGVTRLGTKSSREEG